MDQSTENANGNGASRIAPASPACWLIRLCAAVLMVQPATPAPALASRGSDEIEVLVGPVALYPDPLIAQVLAASAYPDEIADAADWVRRNGKSDSRIESMDWDESVRALARYPDALELMAGDLEWTADLGDTFVSQPDEVFEAIQLLRSRARTHGHLDTTREQLVVLEQDRIRVLPAADDVLYVPRYDPAVVYVAPRRGVSTAKVVATAAVAFGAGFLVGRWLNKDCDWHHRGIYYPGWSRPSWSPWRRGWRGRGPVIINRPIYVNNTTIVSVRPSRPWRYDSARFDRNVKRYGTKYENQYPNPNRYRDRERIRRDRESLVRPPDARGRRDVARDRDLSARPGKGRPEDKRPGFRPGAAAGVTKDVRPGGRPGAADRPRRDAIDRTQLEGARRQRIEVARGRDSRRDSARPKPSAMDYGKGSDARVDARRGQRNRSELGRGGNRAARPGAGRQAETPKRAAGRSGKTRP